MCGPNCVEIQLQKRLKGIVIYFCSWPNTARNQKLRHAGADTPILESEKLETVPIHSGYIGFLYAQALHWRYKSPSSNNLRQ